MDANSNARRLAQIASTRCKDSILLRTLCWEANGGKETEECFKEELTEKRCLAFVCCPQQAQSYYSAGNCALWAEAFAFPDAEHHAAQESVNTGPPRLKAQCREAVMALAKCMSALKHY